MNERHALVEIKREDLPENSPKEDIYAWLSISTENNSINKLEFVSMGEENVRGNLMSIRTFKNGELRFDNSYGKFVIGNDGFILMNCSEELLPPEIHSKILEFFKK